jgi:hypothetical protein
MWDFNGVKMLKIGQMTRFGKIGAIGCREGERYYMMVDKHGSVSLIPGSIMEMMVNDETKAKQDKLQIVKS